MSNPSVVAMAANVLSDRCPSRGTLSRITTRWAVLVFLVLSDGTHRFSEIRKKIGGISEKMLAQTLQNLTQDGLVLRHAHDTVPPHVDYSLTPDGDQAARHILKLTRWIEARHTGSDPAGALL